MGPNTRNLNRLLFRRRGRDSGTSTKAGVSNRPHLAEARWGFFVSEDSLRNMLQGLASFPSFPYYLYKMSDTNNTAITYSVYAVTHVDHPEKRDDTYPVVAAGTKLRFDHLDISYRAAISIREEILRGDYDYCSEFVSRVWVRRNGGRNICARGSVSRVRGENGVAVAA